MFPVVVPSSNPSYDATYSLDYLKGLKIDNSFADSTKTLLAKIKDPVVLGYSLVLINYIRDATEVNPKEGFGKSRTALWGLQRPPVQSKTILVCSERTSWDDVSPIVMMFHVTNAQEQVALEIDPSNTDLVSFCESHNIAHSIHIDDTISKDHINNRLEVSGPMKLFPMAGNFLSCYFPLGHIKVSIIFLFVQ